MAGGQPSPGLLWSESSSQEQYRPFCAAQVPADHITRQLRQRASCGKPTAQPSAAVIEMTSKYRTHPAVRRLLLCLFLALLGIGACDDANAQAKSTISGTGQRSANAKKTSSSRSALPHLPLCPAGGLATATLPIESVGHHQVILSWSASFQSSNPLRSAAGYCLYRSTEPDAAQQMATCSDCEQVSPVALQGTSCVDDQVEDGETYYYVVIAVNEQGIQSSPSNQMEVQIPSKPPIFKSSPQSAVPSCRKSVDAR